VVAFDSGTLFGAALLISVLPFVILLSSLANHHIDTDISRNIGLNGQGARIVSQLFRSTPSHSWAAIVTGLIFATAGTVTVASSLQVIYERIFDQPHRGWKWSARRRGRPGPSTPPPVRPLRAIAGG
jgi:hypothetical protein